MHVGRDAVGGGRCNVAELNGYGWCGGGAFVEHAYSGALAVTDGGDAYVVSMGGGQVDRQLAAQIDDQGSDHIAVGVDQADRDGGA